LNLSLSQRLLIQETP